MSDTNVKYYYKGYKYIPPNKTDGKRIAITTEWIRGKWRNKYGHPKEQPNETT